MVVRTSDYCAAEKDKVKCPWWLYLLAGGLMRYQMRAHLITVALKEELDECIVLF